MIAVALGGRLVIPLPDGSTDIEIRIRRVGRGLARSSSIDVALRCRCAGGEYELCGELPDRGRASLCETYTAWWDEGSPRPVESTSDSRLFGRCGGLAMITTSQQWASWEIDRRLHHLRFSAADIPTWLWESAGRHRPVQA